MVVACREKTILTVAQRHKRKPEPLLLMQGKQELMKRADFGATGKLWYPGQNPASDALVLKENAGKRGNGKKKLFVLLIRRSKECDGARREWALPGGFIPSKGAKGEPFRFGDESPKATAVRELKEETGFRIPESRFGFEGRYGDPEFYSGSKKDERGDYSAWTLSYAFAVKLTKKEARNARIRVNGGDDADKAEWWPIDGLPRLAFDHEDIIRHWLNRSGQQ